MDTESAGAPGLISLLIHDFRARVEGYLREIERAQVSFDFKELKRHAHTMKSSTRVLGLRAASDICREMEILARENVYNPQNIIKLREEIFPALVELTAFEMTRKRG
jgi:HPt (histidine-containing phosphotransfer) domain-containing protein